MNGSAEAPRLAQERSKRLLSDYSALLDTVRSEGLLRRRLDFYAALFVLLLVALSLVAVTTALLGDSWWQLVPATVLGIVLAQFGFVAHEASATRGGKPVTIATTRIPTWPEKTRAWHEAFSPSPQKTPLSRGVCAAG